MYMSYRPENEWNLYEFSVFFYFAQTPCGQPHNGSSSMGTWEEGRWGAIRFVFAYSGYLSII